MGDVVLESVPPPTEVSKMRLRVYQRWQGNEKFFCWGFLVAGPNWKASLGTAVLIAAPSGVFLGFVAPYLMDNVNVVLLIIGCILPAVSMLCLFMTACRDPGILPRQEPDEEYLQGRKPRTREVTVNTHRVLIRYNDTCHFYQPPRAHHCSVNDNCIERFDHHCPWVGTTIGLRNYRTFLLFIYTTTVLCVYVFACSMTQFFLKHDDLVDYADANGDSGDQWGATVSKVPAAIALMIYTFVFFFFVGGLSFFHCYLVGTNQTTYENFRYNSDNRVNPYSEGILRNCASVWCVRIPPCKVKFRDFLDSTPSQQAPPATQAEGFPPYFIQNAPNGTLENGGGSVVAGVNFYTPVGSSSALANGNQPEHNIAADIQYSGSQVSVEAVDNVQQSYHPSATPGIQLAARSGASLSYDNQEPRPYEDGASRAATQV